MGTIPPFLEKRRRSEASASVMKKTLLLGFALLAATALPAQMQKIEWKPGGSPWKNTAGTSLARPTIIGAVTTGQTRALFWGQTISSSGVWSTIEANAPTTFLGWDYFSGQDLQLFKPGLPPGPENWSFSAWNMSVRFGIRGMGYSLDWKPSYGIVYSFTREPLRLTVYGKTLEQFGVQACRSFEWSVYYPRRGDPIMTRDNYTRFLRKRGMGEISTMLADIAPPQTTFQPTNPESSRGTLVVVEVNPYTYAFGEVLVTLEDLP